MAKFKILTGDKEQTVRVKVKKNRQLAVDFYNELTAAVHIGAAIQSQIDRGNIEDYFFADAVTSLDAGNNYLYSGDLIGDSLKTLKRARRKLAKKLEL